MGHPLPTHSRPEAGQAVVDLPLVFERKFRPWRYGIGHSELSLRSVDRSPSGEVIEVNFHGVMGMKLKVVYQPLVLAKADRAASDEMLRFSEIAGSQVSRVQCLTLEPSNDKAS